jgi:predicted NUDIX family phosphoesterase
MFLSRRQAEVDPRFKQLLSYVLVRRDGEILRYIRGRYSSVDDILKGRLCLGFGGHINIADAQFDLFEAAASEVERGIFRELNEELVLPRGAQDPRRLRPLGVINDRSSTLGDTHFAFVYELDISGVPGAILKREKAINQLRFTPISSLGDDFAAYEYWSKLCITSLFGRVVNIKCSIHPLRNFRLGRHDVIVMLGSIGSGKTEAARLLERRFGFRLVSSGGVLAQLLGQSLDTAGRGRFQDRALAFIQAPSGPEALATAIAEEVDATPARCVIDGVRNVRTLEHLKRRYGRRMAVIFVDSTVDNAFRFFRSREDSTITFRDFIRLLNHAVEADVSKLIGHANIVVYNYGSKNSYVTALIDYLEHELE